MHANSRTSALQCGSCPSDERCDGRHPLEIGQPQSDGEVGARGISCLPWNRRRRQGKPCKKRALEPRGPCHDAYGAAHSNDGALAGRRPSRVSHASTTEAPCALPIPGPSGSRSEWRRVFGLASSERSVLGRIALALGLPLTAASTSASSSQAQSWTYRQGRSTTGQSAGKPPTQTSRYQTASGSNRASPEVRCASRRWPSPGHH